ncbi:MAG: LamG domain-containing protein [Promethearchaeota archaeon]
MVNTHQLSLLLINLILVVNCFTSAAISFSEPVITGTNTSTQSDRIVAYWDFNEGEGSILTDQTGNGNHGQVVGAEWVEGINGSALEFGGTDADDYVKVNDADSLDFTTSLTIEAWINARSFYGEGSHNGNPIVEKWAGSRNGQYKLAAWEDGNLRFWITDGNNPEYVTALNILSTNVWHHILATWNDRYIQLFVDGNLVASESTDITSLYSYDYFDDDLWIGYSAGGNSPNWRFDGVIDEVKIYGESFVSTELLPPIESQSSFSNTLKMLARHSIMIGVLLYLGSAAILVLFFRKNSFPT